MMKKHTPTRSSSEDFHIVSLCWGPLQIPGVLNRVQNVTGLRFSHICLKPEDAGTSDAPMFFLREGARGTLDEGDDELLASVEGPGVTTNHDMILSDRLLRQRPYQAALAYVTHLARRLASLYEQLAPSAVVGFFDGINASVA